MKEKNWREMMEKVPRGCGWSAQVVLAKDYGNPMDLIQFRDLNNHVFCIFYYSGVEPNTIANLIDLKLRSIKNHGQENLPEFDIHGMVVLQRQFENYAEQIRKPKK